MRHEEFKDNVWQRQMSEGVDHLVSHVYDSKNRKVLIIMYCDMQFEDDVAQMLFWENLNSVLSKNGVSKMNLKSFMVDNA